MNGDDSIWDGGVRNAEAEAAIRHNKLRIWVRPHVRELLRCDTDLRIGVMRDKLWISRWEWGVGQPFFSGGSWN
jgi:hypothetical protein